MIEWKKVDKGEVYGALLRQEVSRLLIYRPVTANILPFLI